MLIDYKKLMTVHSAVAVPMGIACMLIPTMLLATYEVTLSPMGLVIYQFWGAALFGLGLLSWVLRKATELQVKTGSCLAFVIVHGVNCVMAVRGQLAGANDVGWSVVVLFLLLALGFAYVRFVELRSDDTA